MLKHATGWMMTTGFLFIFIFFLAEVTAEVEEVQSLSSALEQHINIEDVTLSSNSAMYDRNGELISDIYRDENRIYLTYEEIPSLIVQAFIATEDQRFFEHNGYDSIAIARAIVSNARQQGIEEGASTVTQQLARNLFLSHDQTYNRKMSEILYARELEKRYTKEEIIELYLNTVYFHNGVYGIEAASTFYFSKPSRELSLAEVAFLSAVPNNPTHYDPLTRSEQTKLRQEWILQKMLEAGYISTEQYEDALAEEIKLQVRQRVDRYPDYVTYIHHELTRLISASDGYEQRLRQAASEEAQEQIRFELEEKVQEVLEQGVRIETALDPLKQEQAVQTVQQELPRSDIESAVVMIDHTKHEIVALTGGKDYKKFNFHRAFQSFRQPGSAIKPLLVYAPYLNEYDIPLQSTINANDVCRGDYCPRNFGGGQYGMVSLETAFKHSFNTPAIRIMDRVGVETAFSYLEQLPFTKIAPEDYRLPAALGGFTYGVSPLELTSAYTTFATGGAFTPSYGIRQVTNKEGKVLYSWEQTETQLWRESTNEQMRRLLAAVLESGTGQRARIEGGYAGGKTGTTNDFYDLWFVGLTDTYTTGVWVGKDTPADLSAIYREAPHLHIWRKLQ
ncbi:transglycosylase domain-containing protein [Halalkalibacter oceani]|uniref:transglycosylase domain-containing protein n=1 Tax=Halalkalibacter oceani TaxID=1653776 RepID=UPI0033994A7E